ncbi:MAG: DUF2911 domain-containing protein [Thermoanaerobaculia bacterium]|nr:DUF2911 domain-containing protein [Thermoanaerobaculia bacterium]
MKRANIAGFIVLVMVFATPLLAQVEVPRVSPKAAVMQTVGLTEIEIVYSRPGVKERQIWGELVPWGELWRTGANEATTIEFSHDVSVEGVPVPAGKYALFTIPGEEAWTVILNSDWDQPGTSRYDEEKNVATIAVSPESGPWQEWMAFHFPDLSDDSATIELAWKETRIPFQIEVDTQSIVMEEIREELAELGRWVDPYRAASYAYSEGLVNDEALVWIDRSILLQETWWNLSLKARMLAEIGEKDRAIEVAERALEVAEAMENPPNTASLEEEMAEWK